MRKYPYFGQFKKQDSYRDSKNGFIVCFYAPSSGVVVYDDPQVNYWGVGHVEGHWDEEVFEKIPQKRVLKLVSEQ